MASLLGFFKKAVAQVNPFDNGATWQNPNPAPRPSVAPWGGGYSAPQGYNAAQPQRFQNSGGGYYTNPQDRQIIAPKYQAPQVIQNTPFTNAAIDFGKALVNAPIRATTAVTATPLGYLLPGGRPQDRIEAFAQRVPPDQRDAFRNKAYKDLLNQSGIGLNDSKVEIGKKFTSNAVQTAALALAPATGKIGANIAEKVLPKVPTLVARAIGSGLAEAPVGAAYNLLNAVSEGNLTKKNALPTALQGAVFAGGLGVAAPVLGATVRAGGRAIDNKIPRVSADYSPKAPKGVPIKNGVEKTISQIMKQEGLTREQATVRMDEMLRRDLAPGLDIGGTPPNKPRVEIPGKPAKNPAVREVLAGISKSQGKSSVVGSQVASNIATKADELGVKLDRGFTDRYQSGQFANPAEKELGAHIKRIDDYIFKKEQSLDQTIKYRQRHVPQSYSNTAEEVAQATAKLQRDTGAANPRKFATYAEAKSYGLNPKHGTIDSMLGESASKVEGATLNRELVKKGLDSGVFSTKAGNGVQVVGITDAGGNPLFAQKNVADTLNGVLQHDSTGLAKALHKTARGFEVAQDTMLQGGVPGTNANFFVTGQAVKDTTRNIGKFPLHPIQSVKQEGHLVNDFFRGKMKTQERFSTGTFKANGQPVKNADFVRELADHGLYIQPQTSLSGAGKGGFRRGWNSLGNNPTFGRYMPNRMLSTAQEVYSQSVGELGHEAAIKLAADTTKTFTGHVDTILRGRGNTVNDVNGVAFFAPKYRESIIGALKNVVKSVYPTKWADPAYAPSRQLLAGMAVTLAGYEALNRKLTGHSMMENRPGQELSVEVPYGEKDVKGNQKVVNVPFMPGFMTIPRAIVSGTGAAIRGDVKGVGAQGSKALSAPLQIAGNVASNKDYFSRPIYNDQATADNEGINPDNPAVATAKIGAYVGGQLSPAWARGFIDKASGKPTEQAIATAIEAPIRFGKHLNPETTAYFKDRDTVYGSLDKNNKAAWDTIHPKLKNVNGEYMTDKTVDAGLARASVYLDHPDVLAAENEMAARAKARGQKVDPLFDLDGNQQRIALRISTYAPKEPTKAKLEKDNPWYRVLSTARNKFFDSLPAGDPNKPKAPIEFPEPSAQVASLKDAYYQMTDSTMKRQFLDNNPAVTDQFAKEEQYSRAIRAAKDLPQYDKYPDATKDVENLMDFYNSLPQKESNGKSRIRSAWIKSHPTEWAKITDQYSKVAQFNLQNDAEMANFEGENLTDKGIKAISSLAKDLGMSTGSGFAYGYGGGTKKPKAPPNYEGVKLAAVKAPKITGVKVRKLTAPKSLATRKYSTPKISSSYLKRKLR